MHWRETKSERERERREVYVSSTVGRPAAPTGTAPATARVAATFLEPQAQQRPKALQKHRYNSIADDPQQLLSTSSGSGSRRRRKTRNINIANRRPRLQQVDPNWLSIYLPIRHTYYFCRWYICGPILQPPAHSDATS